MEKVSKRKLAKVISGDIIKCDACKKWYPKEIVVLSFFGDKNLCSLCSQNRLIRMIERLKELQERNKEDKKK